MDIGVQRTVMEFTTHPQTLSYLYGIETESLHALHELGIRKYS